MLVRNPKKTWAIIEDKIQPYKRKLKLNSQIRYQKVFQEIYDSFLEEDFLKPGKLGEQFLIAYHCQLSALWDRKNMADSEEENGGEDNE